MTEGLGGYPVSWLDRCVPCNPTPPLLHPPQLPVALTQRQLQPPHVSLWRRRRHGGRDRRANNPAH
jgi:hypothetical protein